VLAACDGTSPPTPTPVEPTAAPTPTAEPGSGPRLNKDVAGKITFWHFWGSPVRRTAIKRVVALCARELPNIEVEEVFKPFNEIWNSNIEAVKAGQGMPDVIVEDRPKLPQRAEENIDQSLQEWAKRDGVDGSAYWPFTWQQTLYNGQTYGIPYETEVRVLYWNKNAFREAGLDPEKPPKTWAELKEYADKLDMRAADGTLERMAFFPLWSLSPEVWGYTNGTEWITKDGKPAIDDPKAVETVSWIKEWVDRYGGWEAIRKFNEQFTVPPNDKFMSGKVAMITDINGYSSQLNFFRPKVDGADLEWGTSDIPYNENKSSWSGGMALSIPRGASNPEAAWEFIKCATSPEAQASWARDTYAVPANKEAANDEILLADPNWSLFVDAMGYTTGGNYLKEYPGWGEQLNPRLEQVWKGELTPEEALKQAQEAVEAKINE
jgi:multiple sugar transport system substrate-binding protein